MFRLRWMGNWGGGHRVVKVLGLMHGVLWLVSACGGKPQHLGIQPEAA